MGHVTAMDRTSVVAKLTTVFHETFNDDTITLNDLMTADDVEGWDSLTHINLIIAVEHAFAVRLTTREAGRLKNVGDLINVLENKLA